jgi:3-keto-5-aminohexanoate cleavage enzyme
VIVNYTTGGSPAISEDERLGPLRARPQLASLDCGSMNFGAHVFENSPAFIERAAGEMRDARASASRPARWPPERGWSSVG